jgi:hypothetical protein
MGGVLNGNGWLTKSALGLIATIALGWVSCQQATLRDITTTQEQTDQRLQAIRQQVTTHEEALRERSTYIQQLKDLDKTTTGDLHRLEVRMVRLEMMMQQMMLVGNIRPPQGLPPVPKDKG